MKFSNSFSSYSQEVSEGEQDVSYQLRVTLFDRNQQHFFGKTWKSHSQRMKNGKISFNEVALYQQASTEFVPDFLSCCFYEQFVDNLYIHINGHSNKSCINSAQPLRN